MQSNWFRRVGATALCTFAVTLAFSQTQPPRKAPGARLRGFYTVKPAPGSTQAQAAINAAATTKSLPLFTYNVHSTRDGKNYTGVIVGRDAFHGGGGGSVGVPTEVVPIVIVTHTIATGFDANGNFITKPGKTVFDPRKPLPSCLRAPNDVPFKLLEQSPMFNHANINFGGTNIGSVQYLDGVQRAQFWQVIDPTSYHLRLNRTFLPAITLDIPASKGVALATTALGGTPFCTPLGIVDFGTFDNLITSKAIPALKPHGVSPSTLPVFTMANVVEAGTVQNLSQCCVLGYHGAEVVSNGIQTYSPSLFDTTGLFGTNVLDIHALSHELSEWANDPFGNNPTPAWGHTGQVPGCQDNLETGDPLTGTDAPRITMSNGFTYHPQELVFWSWFFRSNSVGVHGWFSDNGTFLHDAGAVCQ